MNEKKQELIWLVNDQDEVIGYGEKLEVHVKEQLHRAFSVFIFDWKQRKMLLQKRAEGKYHSGGKWSNACCSHPRKGEVMEVALARRLQEELGFEMPEKMNILEYPELYVFASKKRISKVGKFKYFAQFDGLAEHEIDHVYVYHPTEEQVINMKCNPEEIAEYQWIDLEKLIEWMSDKPDDFSAWFKPAFNIAYDLLKDEAVWIEQMGCEL